MCTATHFEENCSWIWPSVRKKSARSRSSMFTTRTRREAELLRELLHPRRPDLEAHHARDDDERALDDAQRAARLALERRVAGAVDEVDLPPLPLRVGERERDRDGAAAARPRPESETVVPASIEPSRLTSPVWKRSASTRDVLPVPR